MCTNISAYELLYEHVGKNNEQPVLGGYRKDLLIKELTELEEKMLICRVCGGVMREECFKQHDDSHSEGVDPGVVGETVAELRIQCPLHTHGCIWVDVIPKVQQHFEHCVYRAKSCVYSEYGCKTLIQRGKIDSHLKESCNEHMLQLLEQVKKCTLKLDSSNIKIEALTVRNLELESSLKQQTRLLAAQIEAVKLSNRIRADGVSWVVTGVAQQIEERAKIWGPYFYVDGYKFQIMLAFGYEDTSYVALFLCLVRGERDQDMIWPFRLDREKFVFTLRKTCGTEVTLLTVSTSESNTDNFKRPESSRNKAPGTAELVSISSLLSDYCSGDCITVTTCVRNRTDPIEDLNREVQILLRSQDIRGVGVVWKIENISKMMEEKKEKWGPSFYVGRYLFHPSVRFFCNSIPNMGLFITLFKGPYDNEIAWPFRMGNDRFIFAILDKQGNEAVTNSIILSEKNIHFFVRPEGPRNSAYGCANLISHDYIFNRDLLIGNCLNIKIMIRNK
ncbi:TNF receptor-associated factor 6 [Oopsacas minuta]|uniref:TNF receptor-associated factor 6 n=1 Tax=Oopsacas minuta TaxID=111878 RepID=A0AAV7JRM7_9METZ|nr:TNF receptor-associated factor 6 [Oopsacas minuta]